MDRASQRFFRTPWGYLILTGLLAVSMLAALRLGSVDMTGADFFAALLGGEEHSTYSLILYRVRLPRILAAVLAGMALSASGAILQSVTDNGLASPNVIGVNAGAGFGVVLALAWIPVGGWLQLSAIPLFAFLGAFLTTLLVVLIASRAGGGRSAVVLAGVAVTALLNAFISASTLLDTDLLSSYNSFSVGGFSGVRLRELWIPLLIVLVCVAVAWILAPRMDLLCLGEGMARVMGVNVRVLRLVCVLCASALAAAAVSFAGLLGFVGLIVPHAARALVGNRMRHLLPASLLLGGTLTTLADLLGRVILAPAEIPVGIMMAAVGAPFFIFLLFRKRGSMQ